MDLLAQDAHDVTGQMLARPVRAVADALHPHHPGQEIRAGERDLDRPIRDRADDLELLAGERLAAPERAEDGGMPDLGGRDVERLHLALELFRMVDERQQVGERDQTTVVEPPAHEARIVVAALLPVGDDVHAGAELRLHGKPRGIVGGGTEISVGQPSFYMVVNRLQHPARPRPASDSHHGQCRDVGRRSWRRQRARNGDGHHLEAESRVRASQGLMLAAIGQSALANQEAPFFAVLRPRDELVAGHPAPGRKVGLDGDLGRPELEQAPAL